MVQVAARTIPWRLVVLIDPDQIDDVKRACAVANDRAPSGVTHQSVEAWLAELLFSAVEEALDREETDKALKLWP